MAQKKIDLTSPAEFGRALLPPFRNTDLDIHENLPRPNVTALQLRLKKRRPYCVAGEQTLQKINELSARCSESKMRMALNELLVCFRQELSNVSEKTESMQLRHRSDYWVFCLNYRGAS
jgi:hypothetical protein